MMGPPQSGNAARRRIFRELLECKGKVAWLDRRPSTLHEEKYPRPWVMGRSHRDAEK